MSFFEFPHTRTYDSDLGWLIKTMKEMSVLVESMETWKQEHEKEYLQLKELYDEVMSGNFPESITNAFTEWMQRNGLDLVGELVKMVFFGITDDGHFVAYIPESWADIIFNTSGYDMITPDLDYGHLILSYLVGGM